MNHSPWEPLKPFATGGRDAVAGQGESAPDVPPPCATAEAKARLVQRLGFFALRHLLLQILEPLSDQFGRPATPIPDRARRQADFQKHAPKVHYPPFGQEVGDAEIDDFRDQNRAELARPFHPGREGSLDSLAAFRTSATVGSNFFFGNWFDGAFSFWLAWFYAAAGLIEAWA